MFYGVASHKLGQLERNNLYCCECRNPISQFLAKAGCKAIELEISQRVISNLHFAPLPVAETLNRPAVSALPVIARFRSRRSVLPRSLACWHSEVM